MEFGGGDNDDDRKDAISSANAGFGPSEELQVDLALDNDEHLNLDGAGRRIWLVKVPRFLQEKWSNVKEDGKELGRLRVYKKPLPNGDERIALLLPPNKPGEEEVPTEYFMTLQNKSTKNTFIFAEREDVTIGESGWEPGKGRARPNETGEEAKRAVKKRMPTLTGTVHHECNLTPSLNSTSYRSIMRNRQAKAAQPKRTVKVLGDSSAEHTRLGIAGMQSHKFDTFIKGKESAKKGAPAAKMARVARNELLDMLFTAFEQYEYWSIKNLRTHTQQPEVYLREVLQDIAQLHKRGPYTGTYSLQEQYKKRSAAKAEQGTSAAGGSAGGAKKEEDADEEDIKPVDLPPELESDEDDDDDMDEVV